MLNQELKIIVTNQNGETIKFQNEPILQPEQSHTINLNFDNGEVTININGEDLEPINSSISCNQPKHLNFLVGGDSGGKISGYYR